MFCGVVHVLVADGLVNHLADALGTRFWRECGAAASLECRNLFSKTLSKTIDADARQTHVNVVVERVIDDGIRQCLDRLVVCGRKR